MPLCLSAMQQHFAAAVQRLQAGTTDDTATLPNRALTKRLSEPIGLHSATLPSRQHQGSEPASETADEVDSFRPLFDSALGPGDHRPA
jgi:hypothetical protein